MGIFKNSIFQKSNQTRIKINDLESENPSFY